MILNLSEIEILPINSKTASTKTKSTHKKRLSNSIKFISKASNSFGDKFCTYVDKKFYYLDVIDFVPLILFSTIINDAHPSFTPRETIKDKKFNELSQYWTYMCPDMNLIGTINPDDKNSIIIDNDSIIKEASRIYKLYSKEQYKEFKYNKL